MSSNTELAVAYAALILEDDGVKITGDKLAALLKAANVEVEPFWPGLFAKALDGVNVKDLITSVSSGVGSGPAPVSAAVPSGGAPAAAAPPTEEKKKKEEPKEESDDDMGFGLFD